MEQVGKTFSMVRGNTENIVVDIEVDGIATPLVTGDVVNFTMTKRGATRQETLCTTPTIIRAITTFPNGVADIEFAHEDTADIVITSESGMDEYDLEIGVVFADGDRKTPILGGLLKLYGAKNG
jgi:hypothetical protein